MKKVVTYFLLALYCQGFSQAVLKGKITGDSIGKIEQKVNIFIPELSITVKSNSEGEYLVKNLPKGNFAVQYFAEGYKLFIIRVNIYDSVNVLDVSLNKSAVHFPEIVVYGTNASAGERTANDISQISNDEMRREGALNLSDGIAKIPGVSQLTTGAGISKPVIRGLFGNRIQTIIMGLRFDNQQWQDEHGLGLSDVGVDKVEIIKGPASLLYGSEAMGGVINIIEEKPAPVSTLQGDVSTRFFSNTLGNATDLGIKGSGTKFNWRIRIGEESHADYTDGKGYRVLNSRFGGYYAKAGFGYKGKRWISQNNYMFTESNFGFLMDPIQLKDPPDDRMSRDFSRPHHTVDLNVFSSQNSFFFKNSKLKVNLGVQNNNRQEQEGGNKISLDMILNTYILNAIWTRTFNKLEWSLGTQDYYQTNENRGSRTIIPDADQMESSAYSYLKYFAKKIILEGGVRFDYRSLETYPTGNINTDPFSVGAEVKPFNRTYNSLNGSFGFSWFDLKHWNIKSNVSTGYRAGNLAELSSNGLHEGTVRYEIGNTELAIEQNACADILIGFRSSFLDINVSAYYNRFYNYIYLAPTATQYIGFQIFRYKQQNATIEGTEATLNIHPEKIKWFNWNTSYSYVYGILDDGNYLPFIAAPKINSDLKFSLTRNKKLSNLFFKPGVTYVFEQDRPGDLETRTADYYLINAAVGIEITSKKNVIQVSVTGNNLANNLYYDHLSRFKYFGIYNIGRNISLNFKIKFN